MDAGEHCFPEGGTDNMNCEPRFFKLDKFKPLTFSFGHQHLLKELSMGFFSQLFGGTDNEVAAVQQNSSRLSSDSEDGEMALDAATASAVLAEIDIDTAIAAHENWKLRLKNYLDKKSAEDLKPEVVCLDDRCDLGKWLHGPGRQHLGHYPAFSVLIARHKFFHLQASTVVALAMSGDREKANQSLDTIYRHASNQVVLLLKELKRGLARRLN
jgi:hypothetical protein